MTKRVKICLIAAEPSADILGSTLIKALKKKYSDIEFIGVGGHLMAEEGFTSLFPQEKICAMGLVDVIKLLPSIVVHFLKLKKFILAEKPDILITIDAPDFNFRMIKQLQKLNCFKAHYVAPSVWAWRKKRAKKVARYYDHVFTLLPFEPPYFEKEGMHATFVGHPLIEKKIGEIPATQFIKTHKMPGDKKICVLLPGSRRGVVQTHLPIMKEAVHAFSQAHPEMLYVIPTLPHLEDAVRAHVKDWAQDVRVMVLDEQDKYALFRSADLALAVSGTVSVELALAQVPTVIIYQMNQISAFLARMLVVIKYATIINILFDREIYPEYLLAFCEPMRIAKALSRLADDAVEQKTMAHYTSLFGAKLKPENANTPSQKIVDVLAPFIDEKHL